MNASIDNSYWSDDEEEEDDNNDNNDNNHTSKMSYNIQNEPEINNETKINETVVEHNKENTTFESREEDEEYWIALEIALNEIVSLKEQSKLRTDSKLNKQEDEKDDDEDEKKDVIIQNNNDVSNNNESKKDMNTTTNNDRSRKTKRKRTLPSAMTDRVSNKSTVYMNDHEGKSSKFKCL